MVRLNEVADFEVALKTLHQQAFDIGNDTADAVATANFALALRAEAKRAQLKTIFMDIIFSLREDELKKLYKERRTFLMAMAILYLRDEPEHLRALEYKIKGE